MSVGFPKPSPSEDRVVKKRARERALQIASNAVWQRDEYRCRACGRRVIRSSGAGIRGHVHHVVKRSQSKDGRADPTNLVLVCALCHADIHAYRLGVQQEPNGQITFMPLAPFKEG